MLRFAEELLLLLLDNDRGELLPSLSPRSLNVVLAGSVLMDLALEDRIDTALDRLVLVDPTPLGDELLDPTLAEIARDATERDTGYWLARTAERGDDIHSTALGRLTARGILEVADSGTRFFLTRRISNTRRYQTVDGKPQEDVRLRIMRVLFSDDIPDPHDIVLICLADACGIFRNILSSSELAEAQERIELVRRMDAIGRTVARAVEALGAPPAVEVLPTTTDMPEDRGLPIFGSALKMAGDMRGFLLEKFRELGPIFAVRAFGHRIIILAGPKANVFLSRDNRCLRAYDIWRDFHGELGARHSPLGADGSQHIRMRRDHAQVYSRKLLVSNDGFATATRIARREIAERSTDEPVPGLYFFQRIITEQIGVLATGLSSREYIDDIIYFFRTLLSTQVSRHIPKVVTRLPRYRRSRRRVEEMVRKILEAHAPEKRGDAPRDLVDDLLELNRTDPHYIAEADMLIFVLGPMIAGLDTASTLLAFMTYEILKRPALVERMRAEADALFEKKNPTLTDLSRLDVTRRVAMEVMRLYPITPVLPRTAANSFHFEGHVVTAGETVLVAHTVPHLMPEYFPDPHRFDIERYNPVRNEHGRPGVYAPFGVGAHQCLGRSLAKALIAVNMACLLRDADITLHPVNYRLKTVAQPSIRPHRSFRFRVAARRNAAS